MKTTKVIRNTVERRADTAFSVQSLEEYNQRLVAEAQKPRCDNEQTRELELQMTITEEKPATSRDNRYPLEWRRAISQIHNHHILALIERRSDGLVERTEVVSDSDGMDINDLRNLYCFRDGDQCRAWLESIGINDKMWVNIPDLPSPKLPRSLRPWLDEQWSQRKGTRQLLIGE